MPAKTAGKHNLRQRKKLRLGEFQEFGFNVTAKRAKELSTSEHQQFVDRLFDALIEHGLLFGGVFEDDLKGFVVVRAPRGSVTEAQRDIFKTWLETCHELSDIQVGPLKDAWYST
ncbi:50S ribosome-binding protein YggL [Noviherbaspirillum sp. CPCC 100848]|uniref:50S ribosome-binding protein YggL n=1 Tax=Noviherbaspirillum album TaxID=3080276 RepID=A0ABU6JEP6_9BURK|nr:50S ribosome-binding protein YggL [Noviherbaspirillum sp. CPCC 100848]MEC4722010.1 50S ribosome-binding protein YggL [Noviherbaspirillum sp. CPCC 100848]